MMNRPTITSWDYIKDNFQADDRLAAVIKNSKENRLVQRIATAEQLAGFRFQAWLRFENARGGDIYISMNPLKPDARGRTKEDIAALRHLYLDLDVNGAQSLEAICSDPRLPNPSYVLNTSEGKYQVIWKVIGREAERAERLQRAMAMEYGADRAATDTTRVLRIPGFYNKKYEPPYQVTAEKLSSLTYTLSDFRIRPEPELHSGTYSTHLQQRNQHNSGPVTHSERDWAETLQRLERGESPAIVRAWLEQKRQDKHDPAYYAALTVRTALSEIENRRSMSFAVDLS